MLRQQRQKVIRNTVIAIIIFLICFFVGFINYLHPKLGSFVIHSIEETEDSLVLNTSVSHNAVKYLVMGYDTNKRRIYQQESESNKISLKDLNLKYNDKVRFEVYAYNKNNELKKSTNTYVYTSLDLTVSDSNEHYLSGNGDYKFLVDGEITNDKYKLEVYYEGLLLTTINVEKNEVIVPASLLNGCSGRVVLKLKKDDKRVVKTFNLYVNSPVVGNINITNLPASSSIPWDDLDIEYVGGVNATYLIVNLYENNKIVNSYRTESKSNNSIVVPATLFKENTSYVLELVACFQDYVEIAKKTQIMVEVGEMKNVFPVYVDKDFTNLKKGTKVSLISNTKNAEIYYTIDGSEPTNKSYIFTDPIQINQDVTIKAKAIKENMYDSVVTTYNFHVEDKNLVVYLSPSNQGYNYGAVGSGYTTEREMMNKVADVLESYLKEKGVTVYRNNPNTEINAWLKESNNIKSDLHLALHSNGSAIHEAHGIEMYVGSVNSKTYSIANKIYNNLYRIYPNKYEYSNRGVKFSGDNLGEANDAFIKTGTLLEIAYHDYYLDAKWIVDNIEVIAKNIGNSILDYYQVK